jgi:hypothetical protein
MSLAQVTPQMNRAVHVLRNASLPPQDHLSAQEKKEVGEKYVEELKVDFEILAPIDPEQYQSQIMEATDMKR